jgi:mannose-1-phosphate guanylyltransferase
MIGPNCWVCSGATVESSVIFDYSWLGTGVRLMDKLVYGRYCVDKTGATIDVQAAALDWLITDARQVSTAQPSIDRKVISELLEMDNVAGILPLSLGKGFL